MNFFIDFEATQFTNEIISIGCVAENGDTFYSKVRAEGKITPFITNLTGLTQEEINLSPSADQVFLEFYYWITKYFTDGIPKFYVFGNSDMNFLTSTIKYIQEPLANVGICIIIGNLIDFSKSIKNKFKLCQDISLIKIIEYYLEKPIEQKHNALEDALFLQQVFNFVKEDTRPHGPFPSNYYTINSTISKKQTLPSEKTINSFKGQIVLKDKIIQKTFPSIKEATNYIISQIEEKNRDKVIPNNIAKKIAHAITSKKKYCNYKWSVIK
jgi:inhibitor of KinA sporulation pathway (predicted exonuclease)